MAERPLPYRVPDEPGPPDEERRRFEDLELVPIYVIAWLSSVLGLLVERTPSAIVPVAVIPALLWPMLRRH